MILPVCKQRAWSDLAVGDEVQWTFSIDDAVMDQFAALSGDTSPIHTDDGFAKGRGYSGRLVHGSLLAAQLSRLVGMEIPGCDGMTTGFSIDFRGPVYVGDLVAMRAVVEGLSDAVQAVRLQFKMRTNGKVVASGVVEAVVRHV